MPDADQAALEHIQMVLMNDVSVQNQVTLHQLSYIIKNLDVLHKSNNYILNKLNVAKELLDDVINLNTLAELVQGRRDLTRHLAATKSRPRYRAAPHDYSEGSQRALPAHLREIS